MKNVSIFITLLALFSIKATAGSKLQMDLVNLNATLESGFGKVSADLASVVIDPVYLEMNEVNYDLSMKDNFFIIEGPGQKLNLDLKSFRRIFEQQRFHSINTGINIKQGEYIKFNSEYFDVALEEIKLNFFGAKINCAPEVGRDITEEILGLCLKKSEVNLKKGVLSGLEDHVYEWSRELFGEEKLRHLPKFARPVLTNGIGSITNGKVVVRADLKILLTMKLSGTGLIEYQPKEDTITLKIDTLASQTINLKNAILKVLSLVQNDFFSVDKDVLVFNLAEMRMSGRDRVIQ